MPKTIVTIKKGKITVESEGFTGLQCRAAHAPYLAALGVPQDKVTETLKDGVQEQVQEGQSA